MEQNLQTCIIDDHDHADNISLLLKSEFPGFEISFKTNNILQAFEFLSRKPSDLIFLNSKLTDDHTGDLLIRHHENSQIILITDSEKSVIEAIKKGVTNYLLRPVKKLDFVKAVNRASENFRKNKITAITNAFQSKINLPTLQGFKRVNIDEIIRCEADSNYTFIYLADKTKVIVSKTLYDFEKHLSDHNFFRIHHKHLINLEHLKEYIKGKGGQVVMTDNSVLDVSVRKKHDFLHKIA